VGYIIVLQRRDKRRYLLIYTNDKFFSKFHIHDKSEDIPLYVTNSQVIDTRSPFNKTSDKNKVPNILIPNKKTKFNSYNFYLYTIIKERFEEIFGSVEFEKANIYLIYKQYFLCKNCFILRCNLISIDKILFTLSCCNPPLTTIKISGTIRRLIAQSEVKM
jgi:Rpp14/Pop5 family